MYLFAQQLILATDENGDAAAGGSILTFLIIVGALGAIFYFLMIRPQRNMARKRQELSASLEIGDEVRTTGGIIGIVRRIDEDTVVIELEDGSLMRLVRLAIVARSGPE